jgi:glycosyltransferase involved in cell wall biosynthesis
MPVEFSTIIPTFRRLEQLKDTLASVLSQDSVEVEIIVVDDCPEHSAREVVSRLQDPRVIYLANPEPTGGKPSKVRNLGWPLAKGAFIHFLDDDDLVSEGHYAAVRNAFLARSNIGMVFGRVEPFGCGPIPQLQHERGYFTDAARNAARCGRFGRRWAFVGRMLFDNVLLVCSASVLRRECVSSLGGFDPDIRLMEDADFHVRVMRRFGAAFLDRVAVRYRIGAPSLMHSPCPTEAQLEAQRLGHRQMVYKYRQEHGSVEFYGLKLMTRTIWKFV